MGWILIILGILLLIVTIKTKPKTEKEAEAQEMILKHKNKFRIAGIILLFIGILLLAGQEKSPEKKEQQTTSKTESQYKNYKTLAMFDNFESELLSLFKQLDIYYQTENSPLKDNTPRKLYKAKTVTLEVIGNPEIKEASVIFFPSPNPKENLDSLSFSHSAFKVLCNQENNQNKTKIFTKNLNDSIKNFTDKNFDVLPCKITIKSGGKDFPMWVVSYVAK